MNTRWFVCVVLLAALLSGALPPTGRAQAENRRV